MLCSNVSSWSVKKQENGPTRRLAPRGTTVSLFYLCSVNWIARSKLRSRVVILHSETCMLYA